MNSLCLGDKEKKPLFPPYFSFFYKKKTFAGFLFLKVIWRWTR